jgi:polyisoprenoid-binding protein YceI
VGGPVRRRFEVEADASAVIVRARSNVGHIEFATSGLEGTIEVETGGDGLITSDGPSAQVEVMMDTLASGNALYDAELRRRIDARRYPRAVVQLRSADRVEGTDRYHLSGDLTMHGVTRTASGTVSAQLRDDETIVVTGEHVFDIRDFELPAPATMMLKIYPDVRVQLHLVAHAGPS